jgi:hypothetical protein
MLVALCDGVRVEAELASRQARYHCPECAEPVVLRAGQVLVHHFAHRPGSDCAHGAGESAEHLAMKAAVRRWLPADYQVELEVPVVAGRRADVVVTTPVGNRFVVEMQASAISPFEVFRRTSDYRRAGLPVLWVFHTSRLQPVSGSVVRPPGEMVALARACFGKVHLSDGVDLFVGQLLRDSRGAWVRMSPSRRGLRLVKLSSVRFPGRWCPVPVPADGARIAGLMQMLYWDGARTLLPGHSRYLDVVVEPPVCGGCGADLQVEDLRDDCCVTAAVSSGPWARVLTRPAGRRPGARCTRQPAARSAAESTVRESVKPAGT